MNTTYDAGKDGLNVAKDAFGFALNYYTGDYKSRIVASNTANVFSLSKEGKKEGNANLYNGNIKEMVTSLLDTKQQSLATQFNRYTYDQLNRIKSMNSEAISLSGSTPSYKSSYSYDRNGNLLTLQNTAPKQDGSIVDMDNLSYKYLTKEVVTKAGVKTGVFLSTNQLGNVDDTVPNKTFTNDPQNMDDTSLDIDDQRPNNYSYDDIGQLTKDSKEDLNINWRVDGKVSSVIKYKGKANQTTISFEYDGLGNRTAKKVVTPTNTKITYYERDAQGNVLSTYEMETPIGQPTTYALVEQDIYGSSRLGIEQGRKIITKDTFAAFARNADQLNASTARGVSSKEATASTEIWGLKFSGENATNWNTDDEKLNLFDTHGTMTDNIDISSHLKIDATNFPVGTTKTVMTLQGKMFPSNHYYRSVVKIDVERNVAGAYVPILILEKYERIYGHRRGKWGRTYHYYANNVIRTVYKIKGGIPEAEWDINYKVEYKSKKYVPVLTLNGNVYTDFENSSPVTIVNNVRSSEKDYKGNLDAAPTTNYSLGKGSLKYNNGVATPYEGVPAEMCDFAYTISSGEESEEIKANSFLFDEGSGKKAKATTGIEMALGTVQYATVEYAKTYCSSPTGDKDSDGVKDSKDNCPNTYNPDQKDTDGDKIGDVCDNCKYPNPLQVDADHDGMGDGDNIGDLGCDNCKLNANFDQSDIDKDGVGDVCDNCSTISNADQADANKNGVGDVCEGLDQGAGTVAAIGEFKEYYRYVGDKRYELSNHLGNVLSVVSDRSLVDANGGLNPDVLSYSDYYPFGMLVPNRHGSSGSYRYGFQGQEMDNELKGEGNSINFTYRMHDPRVGRFFAVDPLAEQTPSWSPYVAFKNNPIFFVDPDGRSATPPNEFDENGNKISNLGGEKVDFYHQKNGSIKMVDCETGTSNTIKSGQDVIKGFEHRDANVNWETIYDEFKNGNGPKRSLMDGSHPMTKDMKDSQAASIARDMYVNNGGKKGYKAFDFGVSGAIKSGTNMTEQMIGSVGVSIYPLGNKVVMMLTDTKTPRSLFLHLPGIESTTNRDSNYNGGLAPFSETKQTYIWIESVNTLLKKQSDGK